MKRVDGDYRPITRRVFVRGTARAASAGLLLLSNPARGQTPAAQRHVGTALALRTPVVASPWTRIVEYPTRLNAFCLFRDRHDTWHCIGIIGATWEAQVDKQDYIARVSGPSHANPSSPARGGWIEVARLDFAAASFHQHKKD